MKIHKVIDPTTGRSDYIRDSLAMQEQTPCFTEDEVIKPVVNRCPMILGEACTYAVVDTNDGLVTFWQQSIGPPIPLVEGRRVIRDRVHICSIHQLQQKEVNLQPERIDELIQPKVARSQKRSKDNHSSSMQRS